MFIAPSSPSGPLERILAIFSVVTMISTVPQVLDVWIGPGPTGVSLISWVAYLVAACLWLVHGVRKHDPSIYLACTGWIILDVAIVIGIIAHR